MTLTDDALKQGFRIDDTEVWPQKRLIRRNAQTTRVSGFAMRILMGLAHDPGNVIESDWLRKQLGVASARFEEKLRDCIAELRQALDGDRESARHIREVSNVGYQLMGKLYIDVPPVPTSSSILNE